MRRCWASCRPEPRAFDALNQTYRERFGFPFILCMRPIATSGSIPCLVKAAAVSAWVTSAAMSNAALFARRNVAIVS